MSNAALSQRPASYYPARREADALLAKYRVDEPPVPVQVIAQQEGLEVQFGRFPARRKQVSGFIDIGENRVWVNVDESPQRQRFTIAHELGHWLLHRKEVANNLIYRVLQQESLDEEKPAIEKEADAFAAALLVPRKLLDQYWLDNPIKPSRASLARLFGVSEEVIRYRLKNYYGA